MPTFINHHDLNKRVLHSPFQQTTRPSFKKKLGNMHILYYLLQQKKQFATKPNHPPPSTHRKRSKHLHPPLSDSINFHHKRGLVFLHHICLLNNPTESQPTHPSRVVLVGQCTQKFGLSGILDASVIGVQAWGKVKAIGREMADGELPISSPNILQFLHVNWFLLTKELIDVLIKIYAGFLFIVREETKTKSMVDLWILVDKKNSF